ncbi:MAG: DNA repair protein RadA [candidate division Zixibacteria bacterium]|nr:DNA repair protein RadA [candidate division Zixibacteria bacterium]
MKTAEVKSFYACSGCGSVFARWHGRCPDCGAWDTLHEEKDSARPAPAKSTAKKRRVAAPAATPLADVQPDTAGFIATGIAEFDLTLGGGAMPGSTVLVGGEPGIGKSTLLLQVAGRLSQRGIPTLYVSGEESAAQIKHRADRLGIRSGLHLLTETDLAAILAAADQLKPHPRALILDSIQTTFDRQWQSPPGTVAQVRECAAAISDWARRHDAVAFVIGHVTKDGFIAGPKVLEHMVDTVLQFEGDRRQWIRLLRCLKNRYGPTHEVGLFEMTEAGLNEVTDPSGHFLTDHAPGGRAAGSAVAVAIEGRRPLLLEIQSLVGQGVGNSPQRVVSGPDPRRAAIIIAVLQNIAGLSLSGRDIYLNITGGFVTDEPAVDLGCAVAVASSALKRPADPRTVWIGELGLGGEIRGVPQIKRRLIEAEKIGFQRAIVPAANQRDIAYGGEMQIEPVGRIDQALAGI